MSVAPSRSRPSSGNSPIPLCGSSNCSLSRVSEIIYDAPKFFFVAFCFEFLRFLLLNTFGFDFYLAVRNSENF